jgi:hypothetical protein
LLACLLAKIIGATSALSSTFTILLTPPFGAFGERALPWTHPRGLRHEADRAMSRGMSIFAWRPPWVQAANDRIYDRWILTNSVSACQHLNLHLNLLSFRQEKALARAHQSLNSFDRGPVQRAINTLCLNGYAQATRNMGQRRSAMTDFER